MSLLNFGFSRKKLGAEFDDDLDNNSKRTKSATTDDSATDDAAAVGSEATHDYIGTKRMCVRSFVPHRPKDYLLCANKIIYAERRI